MKVYMRVSKDKYELPIAIADTVKELASMLGVSVSGVYNNIRESKKEGLVKCGYIVVEIDE